MNPRDALTTLVPKTNVDFVLQQHYRRANNQTHLDLRLGTPTTGLHSWAIPKAKLPDLKEKLLAVQTAVHPYEYSNFAGELTRGRARGHVDLLTKVKARIVKIGPDKVVFTTTLNDKPSTFSLVRSNKDPKDWIIRQSSNTKGDETYEPNDTTKTKNPDGPRVSA